MQQHVSPGERNPIEGKFGQAKTAYGLNRVKARLRETSESWIACIILVLNLVKLAGAALPYLMINLLSNLTEHVIILYQSYFNEDFQREFKIIIQMLYSKQVELKNQA